MFINYLKIHYSNILKSKYFVVACILQVLAVVQFAALVYLMAVEDIFTEYALGTHEFQTQELILGFNFRLSPVMGALPIALIAALSSSAYFSERYYINYENTLNHTTIYCISEFVTIMSISLIYIAYDAVIAGIAALVVSEPLMLIEAPGRLVFYLQHIFMQSIEGVMVGLIAGKLFRVRGKSILAVVFAGPLEATLYSLVYSATVVYGNIYHINPEERGIISINICSTLFPNYYYCVVNSDLEGGNTSNVRHIVLFISYVILLGFPLMTMLHKRKKEFKKKR